MNIPSTLFAGDSETWLDDPTTDNLGGAIDSTWTLKYVISFASALTLTASANGSGWTTTISKTQSAVAAGDYYWQAYAETGSRRVTLGTGRIVIKAAANSRITGLSQAAQDLAAVQLAMRTMIANGAVQEYTIGGRSMRKMTMADLIQLESKLKYEVAKEKQAESIANGLGNPRNVFVRFK